jgi:hypothetical protein
MRKGLDAGRGTNGERPGRRGGGRWGRSRDQTRANSGQLEPIGAKWRLFRPVEADPARDENRSVF